MAISQALLRDNPYSFQTTPTRLQRNWIPLDNFFQYLTLFHLWKILNKMIPGQHCHFLSFTWPNADSVYLSLTLIVKIIEESDVQVTVKQYFYYS